MRCSPRKTSSRELSSAFTLLELLTVLIIIGLIAAIGLPALKGLGKSDSDISAQRQLLDDIARARQLAISTHSDVYMVFVPRQIINYKPDDIFPTATERRIFTNLLGGQYTAYAILAARQAGDQPGAPSWRYLSEWRSLPEKIFISTNKFWGITSIALDGTVIKPFSTNVVPFPLSTSIFTNVPVVAFDSFGRLKSGEDEIIPLARGSIFYARTPNGDLTTLPADILENLQSNSISVFNRIHIDWLTGRAHVEQAQIQ